MNSKPRDPFHFESPESITAWPGIVIAVNNGKSPNPEEFFQFKHSYDTTATELEKSFYIELDRLHAKYFMRILPRLPPKKAAAHIAYLAQQGVLDYARFSSMQGAVKNLQ
jgi:hypothetical protein